MLERTQLACDLALQAGALVREAMGKPRPVEHKSAVDLVTDVDRRSQDLILQGIRQAFPGDAIVAEESDSHQASDGPCWYVDPLDGTTNFVHALPHFAVSIAFLDGGQPRSAAVYDPAKGELFHAEQGSGAFLGDRRLAVSSVSALDQALLVTGFPYDRREHTDLYMPYFAEFLCAAQDLRRYGSASLDLCYVAAGRFDGFWEWKLQPWDTAAGWLVVREAGGRVTGFDASPYNPWHPRILATNGRIHDEILARMSHLPSSSPAS